MALILALTSLSLAAPVTAADSPEGAVNELIDMAASGDLSAIDQVVCEEQREAAVQQFDPRTALGLSPDDQALLDAFTFQFDDRATEVLSQDEGTATVRLTATLNVSIDEAQARDMVRALLEAEGGDVTDEDIDLMLPFMLSAFGEDQEIDDELMLVLEAGQWLVCGGLGTEQVEPVGPAASVSFEGICGLTSIAQLNAITPAELEYDSSFGGEAFCSYSVSSYEVPPADFDPVVYLTQVAELYVPLIPELEVDVAVAPIEPTVAEIEVPSLCETVSLDQLNSLSSASFDDVFGGGDFCNYSSLDPDSGYSVVGISINSLGLNDMKDFFPDGEDLTVAGQPAYRQAEQLWVGLYDGERTLQVSAFLDASQVPEDVDANQFAADVAELVLADLTAADDGAE